MVGSQVLRPYSTLIGLTILFWLSSSFLDTVATANEDVVLSTIFIITIQLTRMVFMLGGVLIYRSIESLLYAAILVGIVQGALLLWYLSRRFPRFWLRFDWATFKEQAGYVLPFGIGGILYVMQSDFHSYLVANRFPPAQYALYSVGASQLPLVNLLRDSVNRILLGRVSGLEQRGKNQQMLALIFRTIRKLSAIYLPVCAAVVVLGHELLITMYTRQYLASYPIPALNAFLLPIGALISDPVLRAHYKYRFTALKVRALTIPILVGMALWGMRYFGMVGAMGAFVFTSALERVLLFSFSVRILGVQRKDWKILSDVLKFSISAAIAGLVTAYVRFALSGMRAQWVLLIGSAVFGCVYASMVISMRLLVADEKQMINSYTIRYLRVAFLR
ncbi:MAG: oligosaccharide flippase family protein [Acidobacteriota bacterium]|nr:oligosaccharide flippase family protein [Acidobacteriota bacterium]MDQ2840598.1 oligosaccharide flippase family protein [Acidobacteriota bacterium]